MCGVWCGRLLGNMTMLWSVAGGCCASVVGGEGDVVRSPPCDDVMPCPHLNWDTAWSTLVTPMIPGTGDLLPMVPCCDVARCPVCAHHRPVSTSDPH